MDIKNTLEIKSAYSRKCPVCSDAILYSLPSNFYRARMKNTPCKSCSQIGKTFSDNTKYKMSLLKIGDKNPKYWEGKKRFPLSSDSIMKMSDSQKRRFSDVAEVQKTKNSVKQAMHRPDVRKRHIEALHHSKWIKVRTDKGQLELLEKWNTLGFSFQPNYQIHTDNDLFYIDGFDPTNNIVLEYDGKYHQKSSQKIKDDIRQQKIINILHPKKFWRYNAVNKTWRNVR